jgi:ABC-type transport system substrate-binding protein
MPREDPIHSADVQFSLDRVRNDQNGAWNFLLGSSSSITPKGNQVVIKLKNTDPSLPAVSDIFNSAILPKRSYSAAKGSDEKTRAKAFAEKPIGTGPFLMSELKARPPRRYWIRSIRGSRLLTGEVSEELLTTPYRVSAPIY